MNDGISVIIPAYGRATTLPRAIESIRSQPGPPAEIVVVDDATPGGLALADLRDDGVRVIRNEVNLGPGASRNQGVQHASHDVIAFLDADDEWLPASLRHRLHYLKTDACVVGPITQINERLGTTATHQLPKDLPLALRTANPIHPSTIVVGRDGFERAGGFPEDRDCAEDWVFLLRLQAAGIRLAGVPEPVALIHVDGSNSTTSAHTSARHALGAVRHMESERLIPASDIARTRRVVDMRVAGFYANASDVAPAIAHLRDALLGPPDLALAREALRVPISGLRGVIRRRLEPRGFSPSAPSAAIELTGPAVAVASNPCEAWVACALAELRGVIPDLQVTAIAGDGSPGPSALHRWRVRRSGEPDASEMCRLQRVDLTISAAQLSDAVHGARLLVDLSGEQLWRSRRTEDPEVVRVRFGPEEAASPDNAFSSAYLSGRTVDRIDVILESGGEQTVLGSAPVVLDPASRSLTGNAARWKAAATLPRALRQAPSSTAAAPPRPGIRTPPWLQTAARARQLGRAATTLPSRLLMRERWSVALQPAGTSIPTTESVGAASTTWVEDEYPIADPHIVETAEGAYLFVERICPGAPAVIAASRIEHDGAVGPLRDVLVQTHHLSYPSVFFDHGVPWMLPETSATRSIRLFRADDFPFRWSLAEVLVDGITAFDPTLHCNANGCWLWACVAPHGRGRNDELWLFHSPSLLGPWRPHPANPVVDDPRCARPAGGLFVAEGRLIRPAQDCSSGYGRRIVLNEVLELSSSRYRERTVATVHPSWCPDLTATHSISQGKTWQALDGARRVFSPLSPRAGAHM